MVHQLIFLAVPWRHVLRNLRIRILFYRLRVQVWSYCLWLGDVVGCSQSRAWLAVEVWSHPWNRFVVTLQVYLNFVHVLFNLRVINVGWRHWDFFYFVLVLELRFCHADLSLLIHIWELQQLVYLLSERIRLVALLYMTVITSAGACGRIWRQSGL